MTDKIIEEINKIDDIKKQDIKREYTKKYKLQAFSMPMTLYFDIRYLHICQYG